jgi:hypothetical protein
VHARAQKTRWKEEFVLVGYEIKWTVTYFIYQSNQWIARGILSNHDRDPGAAAAYAAKKAARWVAIAKQAEAQFHAVNEHYRVVVT